MFEDLSAPEETRKVENSCTNGVLLELNSQISLPFASNGGIDRQPYRVHPVVKSVGERGTSELAIGVDVVLQIYGS